MYELNDLQTCDSLVVETGIVDDMLLCVCFAVVVGTELDRDDVSVGDVVVLVAVVDVVVVVPIGV